MFEMEVLVMEESFWSGAERSEFRHSDPLEALVPTNRAVGKMSRHIIRIAARVD